MLLHVFPKGAFSHAPLPQESAAAAAKPALSWLCRFLSVPWASKVFKLNILWEISVEKKQTLTKQQVTTPFEAVQTDSLKPHALCLSRLTQMSSEQHSLYLTAHLWAELLGGKRTRAGVSSGHYGTSLHSLLGLPGATAGWINLVEHCD